MKVLSIKQPWAHLIIHHGKNVENRTWSTKIRGRVLIHASKTVDTAAMHYYEQLGMIHPDDLLRGAIVGSVEIVDCVTTSSSLWFQGPYGFVLQNPQSEPIEFIRGKLGFFEHKPENALPVPMLGASDNQLKTWSHTYLGMLKESSDSLKASYESPQQVNPNEFSEMKDKLWRLNLLLKKMDCECGFEVQSGEGYTDGMCYRCQALDIINIK